MLTPDDAGTTGNDAPTGDQAQAAQAQADASEQGGEAQNQGEQQVGRPGYLDSMPDEHKNNEALYQFKTPGDMAKAALTSLEKKEISAPGPDAGQEEKDNWNALLGVPSAPEGYGFAKPDEMPKGLAYSEEATADFAKFCHDNNISKEQGKAIFDKWNGSMAEMVQKQSETLDNAIAANKKTLEEEHKSDYEAVLKRSDEVVFRLGGSKFLDGLDSEGLRHDVLTSPTMINLFLKLEKSVVGDNNAPGTPKGADKDGVVRDPHTGDAQFAYDSTPEPT